MVGLRTSTGQVVTGVKLHAGNQAVARGVRTSEIINALKHPVSVRPGYGGATRYSGVSAEVRVSASGRIITLIRFKGPNDR